MFDNLITLTDSYKVSHYLQYPPGTTQVYSYWESRGGLFQEVEFFGLQYYLKRYFSKRITMEDILNAEKIFALHFGDSKLFNKQGWLDILQNHNGYLPIRIRSVPEGSVIPTRNIMLSIESTDPELPWVTNYAETLLSLMWYPSTVATISREIKKVIKKYLEETGDPNTLDFKLQDFGFRGTEVVESAAIGGAAHLTNFKGTDNLVALEMATLFYDKDMAGFSIPASEHSTITSWGKNYEFDAYRNMLNQFGQNSNFPAVAVVSDSYDIFNACENGWGGELFNDVLNMKNMLVVRPDSGIPHIIDVQVIETLDKKFGHAVNGKGYKILNNVRVIQGDGVSYDEINNILSALKMRHWSADNISFGMGGNLLQNMTRDTQSFAIKASFVIVNGEERNIFKSPITDNNKRSKKGKLKLIRNNDNILETVSLHSPGIDIMRTVFENGQILVDDNFDTIRERAIIL